MTSYVDTSAFVKLFVAEPESAAMRTWWTDHHGAWCSSDLLRTETLRTARRISPAAVGAARRFLDAIALVRLDADAYERAGRLEPATMRSLDALHLAAALSLGDDLDDIVTYDERLAEAAAFHGLVVTAPV